MIKEKICKRAVYSSFALPKKVHSPAQSERSRSDSRNSARESHLAKQTKLSQAHSNVDYSSAHQTSESSVATPAFAKFFKNNFTPPIESLRIQRNTQSGEDSYLTGQSLRRQANKMHKLTIDLRQTPNKSSKAVKFQIHHTQKRRTSSARPSQFHLNRFAEYDHDYSDGNKDIENLFNSSVDNRCPRADSQRVKLNRKALNLSIEAVRKRENNMRIKNLEHTLDLQ